MLALLLWVWLYCSWHRDHLGDHVPVYSLFRCMIHIMNVGLVISLCTWTHQYHGYLAEVSTWVPRQLPGSWFHQLNFNIAIWQRRCDWTTKILIWCCYNEWMPVLLLFYGEVSTLACYIANKQSEFMDFFPSLSTNWWLHHPQDWVTNHRTKAGAVLIKFIDDTHMRGITKVR